MATFDEIFPSSPTMSADRHECASRLDSVLHGHAETDGPALAPVSPCYSEESSSASTTVPSITGKYGNIEFKYHIDHRVLGKGHHGSVRECIDRASGKRFAVKSIRKNDPAVNPRGLAREITLLREMRHRNIVHLKDVFEDAEYVHLVTDLCRGGELFDKIIEKASCGSDYGCFSENEAATVLHQILTAVRYMHKSHVVHRDIKPENILFETTDAGSSIKIIDLGLSRKHYDGIEPKMNNVVGTPYYIAPEVIRKKYDKSCDLWSVGVIAYILLCGYPPFNGADNNEIYAAVRRGTFRFHSSDWSGTTKEARHFIRRLLHKDPRKRMTAEQALNHPWILRHAMNNAERCDEDREDRSSIEVVFNGLAQRDSGDCVIVNLDDVRMPTLDDL